MSYFNNSSTVLRCVIYPFACLSFERKTNSNWKCSLFQLQPHICETALPLSDEWLLPSHWQRMIKTHFSPSLLHLRIFVYQLFGWQVEEMALIMQQRKVAIFCWLIMDSINVTPSNQPLRPIWSLFFRLWVFSRAITNLAVTDLS